MPTPNNNLPEGTVPSDLAVQMFERIIKSAYTDALDVLGEGASDARNFRAKAILAQIEEIVTKMDKDVRAWVGVEIPTFYEMGLFNTIKDLYQRGSAVTFRKSFARFHEDAVQALSQQTYADIAKGMTGLTSTAELIVGTIEKQRITEQIAKGIVTGAAKEKIKTNVMSILDDKGITAFRDKGGREWNLKDYSETLVRTKLTQAHNSGVTNRMVETGYDLVQISTHAGSCDQCEPWQGRILSVQRGGKYPTVQEAEDDGLFHPNCRHALSPYHDKYLDKSKIWSQEENKYVDYNKLMDKKQQDFEKVLKMHTEQMGSIGFDKLADFNKALEGGRQEKALTIAREVGGDLGTAMKQMVGLIR